MAKDVTDHLMDLKGELSKNSALLETVSERLDSHIDKTDGLIDRIIKLEEPISAQAIGKASMAFVAFTGTVVSIVIGILKLLGVFNNGA